jgi:alkylhydroperoxidase family enzyme
MALLSLGDLESAPTDIREALQGRLPVNLYRVMMHAPTALRAFLAFASRMAANKVGKQLREVIILRIAAIRGIGYVLHQHRQLAAAMGFRAAKIAAIEAGDHLSTELCDTERALMRVAEELTLEGRASRRAYDALAHYFTPEQIIEAVMIAGQYFMLGAFLSTFEVEVEAEGEISAEAYLARTDLKPKIL